MTTVTLADSLVLLAADAGQLVDLVPLVLYGIALVAIAGVVYALMTDDRDPSTILAWLSVIMLAHVLGVHDEVVAIIYDSGIATGNADPYERDIEDCVEITLDQLGHVGLWPTFRNQVFRLFSRLL